MQALSKAKVGGNYTIQWLFGLPEVVEMENAAEILKNA